MKKFYNFKCRTERFKKSPNVDSINSYINLIGSGVQGTVVPKMRLKMRLQNITFELLQKSTAILGDLLS